MKKVRPCERWNIPNFVFLQNLKHMLFCTFRKYRINFVKIEFLFLQITHQIFDYDYGMQGLINKLLIKCCRNRHKDGIDSIEVAFKSLKLEADNESEYCVSAKFDKTLDYLKLYESDCNLDNATVCRMWKHEEQVSISSTFLRTNFSYKHCFSSFF